MNIPSIKNLSQNRIGGEKSFIPLKSPQNTPNTFPLHQPQSAIPIPKGDRSAFPINHDPIPIHRNSTQSPEEISAKKLKLRKAAEGFEAIFIRQLLSTMRSTIPDGGMLGSGMAGNIYGDIIDNAMSETMSKRSELGLADVLYNRLVKSIDIAIPASAEKESKPVTQDEEGK
jgi:hypothetical protein